MLELRMAKLYVNGALVKGVHITELSLQASDVYDGIGELTQLVGSVELKLVAPQELIDFLRTYRSEENAAGR